MNVATLFELQKPLREKIIKQHNLKNRSLLQNFVLALQVELGELANEWRGFKHWSVDRKMRRNKALEEYADCLSFILEIGLEIDIQPKYIKEIICDSIIKQFNEIYYSCADLAYCYEKGCDISSIYYYLFEYFIGLGKLLGFSEDEIMQAYREKNAENHRRQEVGY